VDAKRAAILSKPSFQPYFEAPFQAGTAPLFHGKNVQILLYNYEEYKQLAKS
jgi:hypothetical protein